MCVLHHIISTCCYSSFSRGMGVDVGVKGVVCGPEGTHLAGGCVLSKLG
jgi:hypothetical protein